MSIACDIKTSILHCKAVFVDLQQEGLSILHELIDILTGLSASEYRLSWNGYELRDDGTLKQIVDSNFAFIPIKLSYTSKSGSLMLPTSADTKNPHDVTYDLDCDDEAMHGLIHDEKHKGTGNSHPNSLNLKDSPERRPNKKVIALTDNAARSLSSRCMLRMVVTTVGVP